MQNRDQRYQALAQLQAIRSGSLTWDNVQGFTSAEEIEGHIADYALDRAMLVDLQRSRELGGGVLRFDVPWRYVLLEDFRVFNDAELMPDPKDTFSRGRDHMFWKVRYRGT